MRSFWLAFFLLMSFLSQEAIGNHKPKVVATINILADMVQKVGGTALSVESLLPAGTDPHTYEPSPRDASTLAHAKVIFKT